MKKIISLVMAVCMLMSAFMVLDVTASAKSSKKLKAPTGVKVENYNNYKPSKLYGGQLASSDLDSVLDDFDNLKAGVRVSWKKSSGAKKYEVQRKVKGGKYKKVATVKSLKYVDEKVTNGKTYYYKVIAVNGKNKSNSSQAKKKMYLEDMNSMMGGLLSSGFSAQWEKNTKADGYKIYRSTTGKSNSYKLVKKLGKNTTKYTDKTVKLNTKYYYKFIAYKGSTTSAEVKVNIKYQPEYTVKVKAGEETTDLKDYVEEAILDSLSGMGDIPKSEMDQVMNMIHSMLKFNTEDKNIAQVANDYTVKGISAGETNLKMIMDLSNVEPSLVSVGSTSLKQEIGFVRVIVSE